MLLGLDQSSVIDAAAKGEEKLRLALANRWQWSQPFAGQTTMEQAISQ